MRHFVPAEPFPPGEYLRDELNARGWTRENLALMLGMSRRQLNNLIAGKTAVTAETASKIGDAFDQDPQLWMNLQTAYELAVAAQEDRKQQSNVVRKS